MSAFSAPRRGGVLWFTGRPGAGKTTLTQALEIRLRARGIATYVLDGDVLRRGLNSDLGFSPQDRRENVRRLAAVASLFADAGFLCLVAAVSPLTAHRPVQRAGELPGFALVYVDTDPDICEQRDPKGLYARARKGELAEFTGVSAPYEAPPDPDIRVAGVGCVDTGVDRVLEWLLRRGWIGNGLSSPTGA